MPSMHERIQEDLKLKERQLWTALTSADPAHAVNKLCSPTANFLFPNKDIIALNPDQPDKNEKTLQEVLAPPFHRFDDFSLMDVRPMVIDLMAGTITYRISAYIESLIKSADSRTKNSHVDKIDDADDTLEGIADFQIAPFFESDLVYDIAPLREDMIPDDIPGSPLEVWAGHELDLPRQEKEPHRWWMTQWHAGNMHVNWHQSIAYFYTEDFHFENVYTDPGKAAKKLLNLGVRYVVMPNYSVHPTWPIATWIWSAYRSAYVARYFQEAGLMVIPDIQYGVDESLPISMACIPDEAGLCAVQLQNTRGNSTEIRAVARLLKQAEDMKGFQNLIVYGHTDAQEVLDRAKLECNVYFVTNRSGRRREYLNSQSTINSQKVRKGTRKRKASVAES